MSAEEVFLILAFERHYGEAPLWERNRAIRRVFGTSGIVYRARLNKVLDDPKALLEDAPLVLRLRRLRERYRELRHAMRVGA